MRSVLTTLAEADREVKNSLVGESQTYDINRAC